MIIWPDHRRNKFRRLSDQIITATRQAPASQPSACSLVSVLGLLKDQGTGFGRAKRLPDLSPQSAYRPLPHHARQISLAWLGRRFVCPHSSCHGTGPCVAAFGLLLAWCLSSGFKQFPRARLLRRPLRGLLGVCPRLFKDQGTGFGRAKRLPDLSPQSAYRPLPRAEPIESQGTGFGRAKRLPNLSPQSLPQFPCQNRISAIKSIRH